MRRAVLALGPRLCAPAVLRPAPSPPLASSPSSCCCWRRQHRRRFLSSSAAARQGATAAAADHDAAMTPAERAVAALLVDKLRPTALLVQDVSGGCGTMYAIQIASPLFRGHSLLKQQRMVNAALGDLVKSWHGLQIRTSVPPAHDP